jgi:ribosome-associated protein
MHHDDEHAHDQSKSKSQIKREMHHLRDLGEALVKLPKDQFETFDLPEQLHDAVLEAKRIHQHGALKRQLQYIGKLMREVDAEPIQQQLDTILGHSRQAAQQLHHIERWRDKLLQERDHALEELVTQHPEADRQYLRQLLRNARKETLENRPPKSARALFRYLRDLLAEDAAEND